MIPADKKHIQINCYVNGRLRILTLDKAYSLFWGVLFAWLAPLDWFRSNEKQDYMRNLVTKSTKVFAFNLFTRGYLPLTINSRCMLDEHGYPQSRNAFQAKACRLAKLFNGKPPYYFNECYLNKRGWQPAYQMNPGQEWLIVLGVDPDGEFNNLDVDWTIFQNASN